MLSLRLNKVPYPLRFRNLNSHCMRISIRLDVYENSEGDYELFIAKLDDICFPWLLAATFASLRGTQIWRLNTKRYTFEENISSNIPAQKIAQT